MQVKSIAECSVEHSAILLTCIKVADGLRPLLGLFLSCCLRQVSLYWEVKEPNKMPFKHSISTM